MKRSEYSTDSRRAVTDFLKNNSEHHFTVSEIIDSLALSGSNIPKSTVYRCVSYLCRKGTARRFEIPGEQRFAYQYCAVEEDCSNHFHLKCVKCGRLIHMKCNYLTKAKEHILKEHHFLIENEGFISGICAECSGMASEKGSSHCCGNHGEKQK